MGSMASRPDHDFYAPSFEGACGNVSVSLRREIIGLGKGALDKLTIHLSVPICREHGDEMMKPHA